MGRLQGPDLEQIQGEPASGVRAREGGAVECIEQIFTECLLALGSAEMRLTF